MAAFKTNANTTRTPREIALEKGTDASGFEDGTKEPPTRPNTFQPCAPMSDQPKVPAPKPFR